MFVIKTHSMELHPLPPKFQTHTATRLELPVLRHEFPNSTFNAITFSSPQYTTSPTDTDTESTLAISLSFLAYDVSLGLFHFVIDIVIPPHGSIDGPSLVVQLKAVYSMDIQYPVTAWSPPKRTCADFQGSTRIWSSQQAVNDNVESRRYISALALGPQGMRAVWLVRFRNTLVKEIVVSDLTGPAGSSGGEAISLDGVMIDSGMELEGSTVYSAQSYDLRGKCFQSNLCLATRVVLSLIAVRGLDPLCSGRN